MKYKEFSKLIMDSINFIKSLFTLKRNKEFLDERFKYLSGTFHKHGEYAYFSLELDEGGRSVSEPINIPKGCKSRIENNTLIIESEFPHFRKGYVLASKTSDLILIFNRFKDKEKQFFVSAYNNTHEEGSRIYESDMFRRATSEETRRLYKQMKEEGLYWNFITKCVESIDTKTAYNSLWYETDPLWHKISDGDLPNKSGMFLVSIKGGHHQVIRYCHKDKLWATVFEQEDLEYWRENPSLPGK